MTVYSKVLEVIDISEIEDLITSLFDSAKEILILILVKIIELLMFIARPLYVSVISLGIMLYVISPTYRHKRYILAGIGLAIFAEVILPFLIDSLNLIT